MTTQAPRLALAAACACAVLASGCGDSDGGSSADRPSSTGAATSAAPATTASTAPSTPEPTPQGTGRVEVTAEAKRRLRAKGYAVRQSRVEGGGPSLEAALEAPLAGGGGLTVYAYADRRAAEAKAAEFRPLSRKYPDNFRVAVRGSTVYLAVAEAPERLTRRGFARAVAAAEGR